MAVIQLRCPRCNGSVSIEDTMTMGFCLFCGSKITNDHPITTVTDTDHTKEIKEILKSARPLLANRKWSEAETITDMAISLDGDVSDTWFIKALIHRNESALHEEYMKKARNATKALGIFTPFDLAKLYGHRIRVMFPDTLTSMRNATAVLEIDGKETLTLTFAKAVDFGLTEGTHKILLKSLVPRNGSVQEYSETFKVEVYKGERAFYLKAKMLGKGFKLEELFKL